LPSTPAPAAPGMVPGPGGQPIPGLPGAHPQVHLPSPAGTVAPNFQLPTRVPRLPNTGGQAGVGLPSAGGINFSPAGTPAYTSPSPGLVAGGTISAPGTTTMTPQPSSQMSAEEQSILIEAERQAGGPTAALLPPTPLTHTLNQQNNPSTPQSPTINLPPLPGRPPGPY
jgi:hypothetical protein